MAKGARTPVGGSCHRQCELPACHFHFDLLLSAQNLTPAEGDANRPCFGCHGSRKSFPHARWFAEQRRSSLGSFILTSRFGAQARTIAGTNRMNVALITTMGTKASTLRTAVAAQMIQNPPLQLHAFACLRLTAILGLGFVPRARSNRRHSQPP